MVVPVHHRLLIRLRSRSSRRLADELSMVGSGHVGRGERNLPGPIGDNGRRSKRYAQHWRSLPTPRWSSLRGQSSSSGNHAGLWVELHRPSR